MLVFHSNFERFSVFDHAVYNTSTVSYTQGKAVLSALSIPALKVRGISRKTGKVAKTASEIIDRRRTCTSESVRH